MWRPIYWGWFLYDSQYISEMNMSERGWELSQVGTCGKTHAGPNRDHGDGHGISTTVIRDEREVESEFTVSRDQRSERGREII